MKNVDGQMDGQTNGPPKTLNYTKFERNLARMVIYLPVKFEFDWTNRFQVRVRKQKMWTNRWTNGQKTEKRMDRITPILKGHYQ